MIELLLKIKARVESGIALKPWKKLAFNKSYDAIVSEGYHANPSPEPTKKRCRPKKGRDLNMLDRLSEHHHEVLAFTEDFAVPLANN